MRYRTRAFLLCFVPFALLLAFGFEAVQQVVERSIAGGLRASLRDNQQAISRTRARADSENKRFLSIAGENASLKAGLRLVLTYGDTAAARRTLEDQLMELGEQMRFDLLLLSDAAGHPVAAVAREGERLMPLDARSIGAPGQGLTMLANRVYQIDSVPLDQGSENLGALSVGERFDLAELGIPAVLTYNGAVVASSVTGARPAEVQSAFRNCRGGGECSVSVGGHSWLSSPLGAAPARNGFVIRGMQDVDAASAQLNAAIGRVFLIAAGLAMLTAFLCSLLSAESIVKPIAAIMSRLHSSEATGILPDLDGDISKIYEIRELTRSFNAAAGAIRQGRERLRDAYVEFVGSLASALDARDQYTAGHSSRVSDLSCATAAELGVLTERIEDIRIGALLHDIGKIGVADRVLQKPGRLTEEEFALVKQHPGIGKRILEGVHGFGAYLAAVEFHHENHDGTGYPAGLRGERIPLEARIIHVADAYDAMTTDRPYRTGMSGARAEAILQENAGTQFDPEVVKAFVKVLGRFEVATEREYAGAA